MEGPLELVNVGANWLWQGCAVTLAATTILRASRRMSATTRYRLWWVALSIVLVLPALSLQLPAASVRLVPFNDPSSDVAPMLVVGNWTPAAGSVVLPPLPKWSLSLLALVWLAWATVSLSRTLGALVTLRRAKRAARPFPAAREVRLETWLSLRAGGRRATLGVSDSVRAAAVLGLTSPSIVVAPSVLGALDRGGLSDAELDQIVVHEWAHVQRRDDIGRLVQRIIGALAGLHPAVWWIERQLNLERETACDDWAVNATGSARGLAVCLTKLAALPDRPADAVLLPAALLSSELTTRVVRLLDRGRNTSTTRTFGAPMLVVPVLGAVALVVASVELVVTSPITSDIPRAAVSAGPAVGAVAGQAVIESLASVPADVPGVRDASARSTERGRRASQVPPGTPGRSRTAPDSPETRGVPERADAGGTFAGPQNPPRQDTLVPTERPAVEGQLSADLPGIRMPVVAASTPAATAGPGVAAAAQSFGSPTPWGAAADAGVTIGKGSQNAAVATAGFFTRLSRSITGVF